MIFAITVVAIILGAVVLLVNVRKYFVFELDKNSEHYGGELVASALKAHNVPFVFTLCGGHISPILVASEKLDIRVVDVRHEASAVFAADAVSRLTNTVGVAAVTAGPGITNTVTAMKNAQVAESPLVLLAGASSGLLRGRGSLQDIDQMTLFHSLCKWSKRINQVKDIIPVLSEAFYQAASGTPGPVLVEFPIDTLYPYKLVEKYMRIPENPATLMQRITSWYLRFYLFKLFANAFSVQGTFEDYAKSMVRKPWIPLGKSSQIHKLADLIVEARKPLLLISSQALLPPLKSTETADNVKNIGIPIYLSGMARGLLGRNHRLGFRHARREALKEADLIVLAGAVCDFRLDYGRSFNRKAKIVVINRNKKNLYLNADLFYRPCLAIHADVGSTLKQLSSLLNEEHPCLDNLRCSPDWLETLRRRENQRNEEIEKSVLAPTSERVNPLAVLWEIEHHGLPNDSDEDSIIVADGGDFVGSASYILSPRGPLSWLDPGVFGTLGVGGGFALAAKLCRPKATVWVIYGDGSAGFSIAEWDSMARHEAPSIGVIGNDACWSQIAREQTALFKSKVGCQLNFTPYEWIGASYAQSISSNNSGDDELDKFKHGGFRVDESNFDQIQSIINQAKLLSQMKKPSIINCLIAPSNFRDGSVSV